MNERGMTLAETLIYTAILGLIMTTMLGFVLMIMQINNKHEAMNEVNENARLITGILLEKIRRSEAILTPTAGNSGERLEVRLRGGVNSGYAAEDGRLVIAEEGQNEFLSTAGVAIENLQFENLGQPDLGSIRIKMTIRHKSFGSKDYGYSLDLQTAATMRP